MPYRNMLLSVFEKLNEYFHIFEDISRNFRVYAEQGEGDLLINDTDLILKAIHNYGNLVLTFRKSLEEALDSRSLDYSRMRHDLRSPLNIIKNYSEMILEEEGIDPYFVEGLKKLITSVDSVLGPIEKLKSPEGEESFRVTVQERKTSILRHGRILIVDDNENNCDILSRRLAQQGYEVFCVHSGSEAFKFLASTKVDLVLLDIIMPEMTGYEVLENLKSDEDLMDIPVLMISSISEISSVVRCIEMGADDYLPTPFNPTLLRARIEACIDKKLLRDRERENAERLTVAQQQLQAAVESIAEGFAIFNRHDELVMYNLPFRDLYPHLDFRAQEPLSYEAFLRAGIKTNVYRYERRGGEEDVVEKWLSDRLLKHEIPGEEPYVEALSNGRWIEVREYKTPDGGTVVLHKDVTEQKRDEERLDYLAHHDYLTGLGNRTLYTKMIQDTMQAAAAHQQSFALLYFDLDGFKAINDAFGHEVGDKVLLEVAQRLKTCVRNADALIRLGGDEFCLILTPPANVHQAERVAQRVMERIPAPLEHEGHVLNFGVSLGISLYPDDAKTPEDLLHKADQAMYSAKKSGKGQYRFYNKLQETA